MVDIKKFFDKPTFMLISGIWTAVSAALTQFLPNHLILTPLIVTIGNLVIIWLGSETQTNA